MQQIQTASVAKSQKLFRYLIMSYEEGCTGGILLMRDL